MSGAQLLAQVRQEFPETVRLLLTGQSDLEDAIAAVNEGNIFRFLSKPCPPETLLPALQDAVEHNRLIRSERELLEGTVQGSVSLLSEILAIRDPAAAERGMRLKRYVGGLAEAMGIDRPWDIELAATLSEIGYSLIPSDIVERWHNGDTLTDGEEALTGGTAAGCPRSRVEDPTPGSCGRHARSAGTGCFTCGQPAGEACC